MEIAFHLNREYLVNTGTALLTHFITQSNLKIPPSFGYLQGYIIPSTNSNLFKRKEKKLPFTETAKIQRNISTTPLSHSPYAFSTISTPPPVQRPYFHPLQLATISHPLGALCSSELTSPDGEARKEVPCSPFECIPLRPDADHSRILSFETPCPPREGNGCHACFFLATPNATPWCMFAMHGVPR